jgi:hypothetical protein
MENSNVQDAQIVENKTQPPVDFLTQVKNNQDAFRKQISDIDTNIKNLTEHRLKLQGAIEASDLLLNKPTEK